MSGPLVEFDAGFEEEPGRLGYAPGSVPGQLRLMAALDGFLAGEGLAADPLSVEVVERFVAARRSGGMHMHSERALGALLGYLRGLGVVPVAVTSPP